ncbi:MAG: hypothetical protein WBO10_01950 [Pyrinomonadaceae bacterium]
MSEQPENEKPTPKRKSDKPYSYRPQKGDEATQQFLADLLEKNGGNRNQAIEYCVKLAMGQPVKVSSPEDAGLKLRIDTLARMEKELQAKVKKLEEENISDIAQISDLKSQISQLKTQDSGLTTQLSEASRERLAKVLKHRSKLKDELEALEYCILYTVKNDWL